MLRLAAIAVTAAIAAPSPVIVWVKVSEPMESVTWSVVEDLLYVDRECRSDNTLPRVCLYRALSRCRIISRVPPEHVPKRTRDDLAFMCSGYFPEPILLQREFSNPAYHPNQAAPSIDAAYQYRYKHNQ